MKKQILLFAIMPVLFLVFGQKVFGQVKHVYGFYYTYDLRRTNDPAIEVRSMPFGFGNEPEYVRKFFEDTLPCVKQLKESKEYSVYDSVYKFYGFMGNAQQKHADSMFLKMCSPDARVNPGDWIQVMYLNTKNVDVFNYDLRIGYYNGKVTQGLIYYQVKNGTLFGRYKIEGNNTSLEADPFDVTVKEMISYESNKRKLAKLVPVKPVTTGAVTYTEEKKKGGRVVVKILQDGEPAFPPVFDSVKYKDSVSRRIAFVSDSMQKIKTADSVQKAQLASKADSTAKAQLAIAKAAKNAEWRAHVADSIQKHVADSTTNALVIEANNGIVALKKASYSADSFRRTLRMSKTELRADSIARKKKADSSRLAVKKARADSVAFAKKEAQAKLDSVKAQKELAHLQKKHEDSIKRVNDATLLAARMDSIKQVHLADSIQNAHVRDSTVQSLRALATADSIRRHYVFDSTANALRATIIRDSLARKHGIDSMVTALRTKEIMDSVLNVYRLDSIAHSYEQLGVVNRMKQNNEFKKLADSFQEQTIVQKTFAMPNPPTAMFENTQSPNIVSTIPAKDERYITIQGVTYDREKYDIKLIEGPSTDGPNGRKIRHFHYQIKKK